MKVELVNLNGKVLSRRSAQTPRVVSDLASEYDAESLWRLTSSIIGTTVAEFPRTQLLGLAVSGQGDGCLLIDRQGRPIRPAIDWTDGRAADLLHGWESNGVLDEIGALAPAPLFPGSTLALLAWLTLHEPSALQRATSLLFCKDFVRFRLTGERGLEWTDCYYLCPDGNLEISGRLGRLVGLPDMPALLGTPAAPAAEAGRVTAVASEQTGLPRGLPVAYGAMDVIAAAAGVGLTAGAGFSILGTTAIHAHLADGPARPPVTGAFAVPYAERGRVLVGMAPACATGNLEWVTRTLFGERAEDLALALETAAAALPGSDGLMFHPYLSPGGERAPFSEPTARAQFFGLTRRHGRAELARSVLEGVAFAARDSYESLGNLPDEVVLTGGGSESRLWCSIVADILQRPVQVGAPDAGCLGAARLAARAAGVEVSRPLDATTLFLPDPGVADLYAELFELYCRIRVTNIGHWRALAATLGRRGETASVAAGAPRSREVTR